MQLIGQTICYGRKISEKVFKRSWKTKFFLGSFGFSFSITALVDDFASFLSSKLKQHISVALSFMVSNGFLCFLQITVSNSKMVIFRLEQEGFFHSLV